MSYLYYLNTTNPSSHCFTYLSFFNIFSATIHTLEQRFKYYLTLGIISHFTLNPSTTALKCTYTLIYVHAQTPIKDSRNLTRPNARRS